MAALFLVDAYHKKPSMREAEHQILRIESCCDYHAALCAFRYMNHGFSQPLTRLPEPLVGSSQQFYYQYEGSVLDRFNASVLALDDVKHLVDSQPSPHSSLYIS